jgi:peptidoglycan/LPS O-acetylase OafA/YrhL
MRYGNLDALRGVAALAVVMTHLSEQKISPSLVPRGHLAVDFFFALSGFVIAYAYGEKLEAGTLSLPRFLGIRATRLMPLAILGALSGAAILVLKLKLMPDRVDAPWQIVLSGLLNSALLPTLFGGAGSEHLLFPGDPPLWSLFFEMAINIVWAMLLLKAGFRTLAAIAIISGVCLSVMVLRTGTANLGYDVATFWGGALRVCLSFSLGLLIYKLRSRLSFNLDSRARFAVAIALALIFATPMAVGSGGFDLFAIFIAFPLAIVVAMNLPLETRLGAFLGEMSYPIYVLHFPILMAFSALAKKLPASVNPQVLAIPALVTIVIACWVVLKVFDEPARKVLRGLSHTARPARAEVSST